MSTDVKVNEAQTAIKIKQPKKEVYYEPVLDEKLKNILNLDLNKDLERAAKLELTEIQNDLKKSRKRNLEKARDPNAQRSDRSFRFKVKKDKKSAHASASASCMKRLCNTLIRISRKCNQTRQQIMNLDTITDEVYDLGLLRRDIQVGKYIEKDEYDNEIKIFIECNQCNNMNDFEMFCTKNNLNEKQRNFFLTTKYEEKLRLAARKKKNSPLVVRQDGDEEPIIKYFSPKIKYYFLLDGIFVSSVDIAIERRDQATHELLKVFHYRLEYGMSEIKNKGFNVYGEKKQKQLDEANKIENKAAEAQPTTSDIKIKKIKLVPMWIQSVKISSLNKLNDQAYLKIQKTNQQNQQEQTQNDVESESESGSVAEAESGSVAESESDFDGLDLDGCSGDEVEKCSQNRKKLKTNTN